MCAIPVRSLRRLDLGAIKRTLLSPSRQVDCKLFRNRLMLGKQIWSRATDIPDHGSTLETLTQMATNALLTRISGRRMVSFGITKAGFVRLSIPHPRLPETSIHRLNLAFPMRHPREAILTLTLFWFPRLITVIPKSGMGASGNTTQGRTKPGSGDPISALTIKTLGRATKDTLTFEEQPPSLSDPTFINR